MPAPERFKKEGGIFVQEQPPRHRSKEYEEVGFDLLLQMQREHFWYRGRHALLLNVLNKEIRRHGARLEDVRAIDLGGGCGGWLEYLNTHRAEGIGTLALGDSSMRALSLAGPVVDSFAARYHVDLLKLPWENEWDIVFLLDVLEHIPDHEEALRQVRKSLRPGGLVFVTAPALPFFWSYNDEWVHHQRRYRRSDFKELGERSGLELLRTEYFMFFLSPAVLLSRMFFKPPAAATPEEVLNHLKRAHAIPPSPINEACAGLLSLESFMINGLRFPWGTSVFSVFRG